MTEEKEEYKSFSPPKYIQAHWDSPWVKGFIELRDDVQQQITRLEDQVKALERKINPTNITHKSDIGLGDLGSQ